MGRGNRKKSGGGERGGEGVCMCVWRKEGRKAASDFPPLASSLPTPLYSISPFLLSLLPPPPPPPVHSRFWEWKPEREEREREREEGGGGLGRRRRADVRLSSAFLHSLVSNAVRSRETSVEAEAEEERRPRGMREAGRRGLRRKTEEETKKKKKASRSAAK